MVARRLRKLCFVRRTGITTCTMWIMCCTIHCTDGRNTGHFRSVLTTPLGFHPQGSDSVKEGYRKAPPRLLALCLAPSLHQDHCIGTAKVGVPFTSLPIAINHGHHGARSRYRQTGHPDPTRRDYRSARRRPTGRQWYCELSRYSPYASRPTIDHLWPGMLFSDN